MKGKFLSSLFLIVLLNLLIKPFYILGIDAEVQNRVGEEIYGNYFSLLNFSFLLNILLDLGITNYNTRNIAQHPQLLQKHFYRIFSIRMGLFLLYVSFTSFAGLLVGFDAHEFYLLAILMFNQFLVAIIQFSRSNLNGLHLFKTDAFISVLDRSLLIIFCSIMLWTNVMGETIKIEWFIYAQTLAYAISAIISVGVLSSKVGRLKLKIQRAFSTAIIKQSFPYALLIFLMMMYNRIDAVMIERMLGNGDEQAGLYAQGFRILDAVNMFALLFAGLLLPIFARLIKQKESVKEMKDLALALLLSTSVVIAVSAFWFRHEIIQWRYPAASVDSGITFGFLILSFIPVAITYIYGTLLTANGNLKQLNIMAAFGLILNVVLNAWLISDYQAMGASVATLSTQAITAIIQVILVYFIFRMKPNYILFGKLISLVLVMIGALWTIENYLDISGLKGLGISILIGGIASFGLRLIKISDLKQVLAEKSISQQDQTD